MWVRTGKGVSNLENGQSLYVRCTEDARKVATWDVISSNPSLGRNASQQVLGTGYTSEAEANAALDELLAELDIKAARVARPNKEDEEERESD